ncbi:ABC transporter permease [Glaciimonas sp. PAMC28666]|uniref:ABC transporter permease n=1 Tax=Glaciimonas sp. PAMC28666 TaxID=2807626 RepID=UPI001965A6C5|nr:ABC transporter permease [Glaciimonas sp. PAMC28666]QRX81164.1 ABC transporter permease [Glaciimonas sp. PAMC28666]
MTALSHSATLTTFATWKALFLREAVNRLSSRRAAWVWILFEPLSHIVFLMFMFTAVRVRTVSGIDAGIWIMVGMLAFFVFKRTSMQSMHAIGANKALFSYRQVKPVDTVLVRAGLEGFLMMLVVVILLAAAGLLGFPTIPADPLAVLVSLFGLWLAGLGFGLVTSVAIGLIRELEVLVGLLMMPLYFISGVMIPIGAIPQPYRDYLLMNPLVHGVEAARAGFAPYYHAAPELSMSYLYGFALTTIFSGLVLHRRFARKLVAQ